ncbi:hypothetical protein DSO57_1031322 [Entomophthora muscae]|uniref:Uncharacterized protein n=2 Tax=Entomophthora muscae TaxID=34485 RepID=A0ACC2TZH0_9FUNG|nr:hypothetical protein DSO57_1029861 [Entomophthora muscae]KAJ9079846.1 hypothetical protein DSO57_1031322 [Entomophthora muscae]
MQFSSIALLLISAIQASNITLTRRANDGCRPLIQGVVYDCGASGDVLEIRRATMNPSQPQPGRPIEFRIQGYLREEVTFGSRVVVNGKLDSFEVVNFEEDICQGAQQRKLPIRCPLKPPTFDFRYSVMVPLFAPSGHYEVVANAINQNTKQIFNVMAEFDL